MRVDSVGRPLFDLVCKANEFVSSLETHFDWIACVPDSIFKLVLPALKQWHLAPRENHAIAMAFGAKLGGKVPIVLLQNSGLGLCIDAILGTFKLHQQGLVIVASQRGELPWEEIQHRDWGKISSDLIAACGFSQISFAEKGLSGLQDARNAAQEGEIVVLTIQRGNLNE